MLISLTLLTLHPDQDDTFNINNIFLDNAVNQIYPSELQLNEANVSDTDTPILDLHFFISSDIISTKIYYKNSK